MDEKERARALGITLGQIEKQFGKGSIMRLGAKEALVQIAVIPSGSISLDYALGVGGFPRGRIIEIFGPEASGKTTLALHVVANAQRLGGMAAFIDVEHALDPIYARNLGVDVDNLLVSQPDYAEQALEIASALISSGSVDVLVIDTAHGHTTRVMEAIKTIKRKMPEAQLIAGNVATFEGARDLIALGVDASSVTALFVLESAGLALISAGIGAAHVVIFGMGKLPLDSVRVPAAGLVQQRRCSCTEAMRRCFVL